MPAGYSGTPLVKKLGIKPEHRVATIGAPAGFRDLLVGLPKDVKLRDNLSGRPDVTIAFFTSTDDLERRLPELGDAVYPDRALWIAWPKQSSGVDSDLTGNIVRAAVLRTRLVDVKVCAISETWSGLKVVWRVEHRR